jgi:hypothetical protein
MLTTSYIVPICSLGIEYIDMGHVDSVFRVRDDEPTCLLYPGRVPMVIGTNPLTWRVTLKELVGNLWIYGKVFNVLSALHPFYVPLYLPSLRIGQITYLMDQLPVVINRREAFGKDLFPMKFESIR